MQNIMCNAKREPISSIMPRQQCIFLLDLSGTATKQTAQSYYWAIKSFDNQLSNALLTNEIVENIVIDASRHPALLSNAKAGEIKKYPVRFGGEQFFESGLLLAGDMIAACCQRWHEKNAIIRKPIVVLLCNGEVRDSETLKNYFKANPRIIFLVVCVDACEKFDVAIPSLLCRLSDLEKTMKWLGEAVARMTNSLDLRLCSLPSPPSGVIANFDSLNNYSEEIIDEMISFAST